MAASLEKCIVYAVSRTSVDDGHRGTIAWFSMIFDVGITTVISECEE